MTNPYSGGNDDFPRYEPTNHPEDRPDYGQLPSYGGAHEGNAQGYAGYHAGQPQHTGRVSAIDAVSWAFRAVFSNWKLWILGTLLAGVLGVVFFAISGGVGAATASVDGDISASSTIMQIISWVIGIVLTLMLMRLALFQIDDSRTGWGYLFKNVRWWQPLVIMVVIGVVAGLISFVALRGSAAGLVGNAEQLSDEEAFTAVMGMLGVLAVISLISFFVQPLFSLMQWFAADGDSVGDAVKKGFQAGKNNYGQLLLLSILNFFIVVAGFLLLGIGLIVAYPVTLLAQAHMYRQCAGRNIFPQA
ncbi:hypothetical protein QP958_06635 [Corynebacterium marquesiae]|uniref:hypothetical protein n=1 Tax=Corynebacterium marquesiae TaxID=2913503 RepID=UPI00254ED8DF|nr:hypothetical protein [Corynebacterium marquesiae]MDK8455075.1 hypothetical protein [Corynebacterium marquesiae]MDK8479479.1 hypothetical protein [Corynebacterium marquesiae]MDK8725192.1 hypothetical protein [Corynebacterium marquesiae]MDK8770512.1 hypothetical protein [Corynebacterium marquesiae]